CFGPGGTTIVAGGGKGGGRGLGIHSRAGRTAVRGTEKVSPGAPAIFPDGQTPAVGLSDGPPLVWGAPAAGSTAPPPPLPRWRNPPRTTTPTAPESAPAAQADRTRTLTWRTIATIPDADADTPGEMLVVDGGLAAVLPRKGLHLDLANVATGEVRRIPFAGLP